MRKISKDVPGFITILILFLIFWFLISPYITFFNIFMGVASSLGLTYFWRDSIFNSGKKTSYNFRQVIGLIYYLIHLLINIIKANINVAKIVLSRKMPIEPGFIVLKTSLEKDLSRVLYANSITLTPGTITIDLEDDRLMVHALTEDAAQGVSSWYLQDMMKELEGRGNNERRSDMVS